MRLVLKKIQNEVWCAEMLRQKIHRLQNFELYYFLKRIDFVKWNLRWNFVKMKFCERNEISWVPEKHFLKKFGEKTKYCQII